MAPDPAPGVCRVVVGLAVAIAAADALQVALLPWVPKHVFALGGALLYGALAVGVARGSRAALVTVLAMPLIPLGVLSLSAAGVALGVAPDRAMVGILLLQVAAAGAAGAALARAGS